MHKKIKSSKKNEKKGGADGNRSRIFPVTDADSTPAPIWQLAQVGLEVVHIFFYACTHARARSLCLLIPG